MRAMALLGVPYDDAEIEGGIEAARAQAEAMIAEIIEQDGADAVDPAWTTSPALAVTAYLQRLGTDLFAIPETPDEDAADGGAP
jgi:cbb3-type cytochrome oxidase cytochrome c subunit